MKLVEDWKKAHTWLSMRLMAIAGALPIVWLQLPDDWKAAIPRSAVLVITAISAAAMIGRVIDQTKPEEKA